MGKLALDMFLDLRKSKKSNDVQITTPIAYPTGFLPLDYINGQRIQVFDDYNNLVEEYDSVGLVDGSMTAFISDPGLGKTTLSQQIATEIVSRFENGYVVHEDIEQSSYINRVFNITGQDSRWIKNHYVIFQDSHAEQIVDRFLDHARMKLNNRKEFSYDSGLKDIYGNKIERLVPTVVIIDSLSVMRSEEGSILMDDKNKEGINGTAGNNMQGARNAKFNSEIFKQILPWAKKANILLFVINQINRKIQSGFLPAPRDLVGLGESESISGGRVFLYLCNYVIRLKNKGMLKADKDYGINGILISGVFYKSRTNATNVDFELIFDKQNGFSKTLTLLHFAISKELVKKQGNKYIIPGFEDSPFTKKTFCKEVCDNPSLIAGLYNLCLPTLQGYLQIQSVNEDNDNDDAPANMNMLDMLSDDE